MRRGGGVLNRTETGRVELGMGEGQSVTQAAVMKDRTGKEGGCDGRPATLNSRNYCYYHKSRSCQGHFYLLEDSPFLNYCCCYLFKLCLLIHLI
jgi:hypothetical protein